MFKVVVQIRLEIVQKDVNSARRALFPRDASEASNLILAAELQAENDTTSVKFTKVHFKVLFSNLENFEKLQYNVQYNDTP